MHQRVAGSEFSCAAIVDLGLLYPFAGGSFHTGPCPSHALFQKPVSLSQSPGEILRCSHKQFQGKAVVHGQANPYGLVDFVPRRHDDQDIHVAIGVRFTVGIGSEKDDFVGLKSFSDTARELADHSHGNIRPAIPACWRLGRFIPSVSHEAVLPDESRQAEQPGILQIPCSPHRCKLTGLHYFLSGLRLARGLEFTHTSPTPRLLPRLLHSVFPCIFSQALLVYKITYTLPGGNRGTAADAVGGAGPDADPASTGDVGGSVAVRTADVPGPAHSAQLLSWCRQVANLFGAGTPHGTVPAWQSGAAA